MRLFGFDINRRKKKPETDPTDQSSTVNIQKVDIPKTTPPAVIQSVKNPGLTYMIERSRGRGAFVPAEYDLAQIGRIEDTDGYVRQAFKKKIGLMFKEGFSFVGPNPRTVKYIKIRLAQIAAASGIPTGQLIRHIGSALIKRSNGFIIKVRDNEASGGRIREDQNGKELKPIAGYFIPPPETMEVDADEFGRIRKWRQRMPSGFIKEYRPEDVIHFTFDVKEGFLFGTPTLVPVIDDIRALRNIEENIELLVYQHLFPLFHYKVGTETAPAGVTEKGELEVDVVRREIQFMPSEGGIVTPERHEITAIGAEGRALRAEGYLEYYKKRVFSGLGVSAVDMGEGECYDEWTETLTENGWKFFNEINHQHEHIATYNPETKRIEFNIPNYSFKDQYSGDMITFKGKHLDIKVTPHHEMWILPRSGNAEWQKVFAHELFSGKYSEFYMLESAPFVDSEDHEEEITFLANGKKPGRAKDITVNTSDFAEFLGYYLSEGCLDKHNGNQGRYRTIISQNRGEILNRITSLVEKMGLSYSTIKRNNRPEESGIRIYGKAIYKWLENNVPGNASDKFIPECVWHWDTKSRYMLLQALISGDGSRDEREGRESATYYTTSKELADDVQTLAMSIGLKAKIEHKEQDLEAYGDFIYRVHISGTPMHPGNVRLVTMNNIDKEFYQGMIYCYNVPNHLFVTRRNGKVTIQGNTANRATADNMSRALIDDVKDFQSVLEEQFNDFIIKELLLESTFGDDVLNEENLVKMRFKEIDIDKQIKVDSHAADMFAKHGITHDELREIQGREVWMIPSTPQENDPEQYPEWHRSFFKLFEEPAALIQAVDEPYSPAAQTAAGSPATQVSEEDVQNAQEAQQKEKEREARSRRSASQQQNAVITDNFLNDLYNDLEENVVFNVHENLFDNMYINAVIRAQATRMSDRVIKKASSAFIRGYSNTNGSNIPPGTYLSARNRIESRSHTYIGRLTNSIMDAIMRKVDNEMPSDRISVVRSIFSGLKYRTDLITDVEVRKAYNLGVLAALKDRGINQIKFETNSDCVNCANKDGEHNIVALDIDELPPFHGKCICSIKPIINKGDSGG